jgi:hypothetical protein
MLQISRLTWWTRHDEYKSTDLRETDRDYNVIALDDKNNAVRLTKLTYRNESADVQTPDLDEKGAISDTEKPMTDEEKAPSSVDVSRSDIVILG